VSAEARGQLCATTKASWLVPLLLAAVLASSVPSLSQAQQQQGTGWQDSGSRIDSVQVHIRGLEQDPQGEARLADQVRRTLSLFPQGGFDRFFANANMEKVRRLAGVASASYSVAPGIAGGLEITVDVTATSEAAAAPETAGAAPSRPTTPPFPTLYSRDGTYVKLGLSGAVNFNANDHAWYGHADELLAGNPLVHGAPGPGVFAERSAFVELGLYGITPITQSLYGYAGLSYLTSASSGQDMFENRDRVYGAVEDAYGGLIGGFTTDRGDRLVWNVTGGRKKFSIGDGFLIGATSGNGGERAMINYSPRWAADQLLLGEVRFNIAKLQVFSVDPDEMPEVDSHTRVVGANLEIQWTPRLLVAATHLHVPESNSSYFLPDFSPRPREGLRVYDARFNWLPPPGRSGPVVRGEFAQQTNANFPMLATGGWAEIGWAFAPARWSPRVTYRYGYLSGDDPRTTRYERWDPLLMGTSPWDWVQGMNHGKVFGNSNRISHRLQLEVRPRPDVQLISQCWQFRADEFNNAGGLGPLTTLSSKDLGSEFNVMARWFVSSNLMFQAQVAFTQPGAALNTALGDTQAPWTFFNTFVRVSF
jgi:hypothetical protein